jgi:hypothetical protein
VDDDKIDDAKKYTYFAGNSDHHADAVVRCGVHCPMERIPGFTRSHCMPPLNEYLAGIPPVAAMVNDYDCNHKKTNKTQLLASNYHTLFASNPSNFWDPKWTLYSHHQRRKLHKHVRCHNSRRRVCKHF